MGSSRKVGKAACGVLSSDSFKEVLWRQNPAVYMHLGSCVDIGAGIPTVKIL